MIKVDQGVVVFIDFSSLQDVNKYIDFDQNQHKIHQNSTFLQQLFFLNSHERNFEFSNSRDQVNIWTYDLDFDEDEFKSQTQHGSSHVWAINMLLVV